MRKKNIDLCCRRFRDETDELISFLESTPNKGMSEQHKSWLYNYAIIHLYRAFEAFVLDCLIGLINNDTTALSESTGYDFPKHLTDEVCEYLIIGNGYFDFRGRSGLISNLKKFLPKNHWFIAVVSNKQKYMEPLDRLSALRNYAAHESAISKKAALTAVNQQRMGTAGAWLKSGNRFLRIAQKLKTLATEVETEWNKNRR